MQYIIRFLAFAALSLVAGCAAEVEFTKNPDALSAYQRSRQASMEGLHTDALRYLQTAVAHDPQFAEGHMQAGHLLMWLGRAEEGIGHYEEAIRVASRPAAAWLSLANALGQVGRHEAGLEAYRRAAELDPGLARARADVARTLQGWLDNFVPVEDRTTLYELDAFTITAPASEGWWMSRGATLSNMEFHRISGRGRDHTVIARAASFEWPNPNVGFEAGVLRAQIEASFEKDLQDPSRFSDLRFEVTNRLMQGMSCAQALFTVQDRRVPYAPGQTFTMSGWDIRCLNPNSSTPVVLHLAFSQRYDRRFEPLSLETEENSFIGGARMKAASP